MPENCKICSRPMHKAGLRSVNGSVRRGADGICFNCHNYFRKFGTYTRKYNPRVVEGTPCKFCKKPMGKGEGMVRPGTHGHCGTCSSRKQHHGSYDYLPKTELLTHCTKCGKELVKEKPTKGQARRGHSNICEGCHIYFRRNGTYDRPKDIHADENGKTCKSCNEYRLLPDYGHWAGALTTCRTCRRLKKYGKDFAWYKVQVKECSICGIKEEGAGILSIDHNHKCCPGSGSCGECVRGLLCGHCNRFLGYCDDSISEIESVIAYIEKWDSEKFTRESYEHVKSKTYIRDENGRECVYCKKYKSLDDFSSGKNCCRICLPLRKHKLPPNLFETVGNSCAICGEDGKLVIDHDHDHCPGVVGCYICFRGTLCNRHNCGLGQVKDSTSVMRNAIEYLRAHSGAGSVV